MSRTLSWLAAISRIHLPYRRATPSRRTPRSPRLPFHSSRAPVPVEPVGISAYDTVCSSPVSTAWKLLEKEVGSSSSFCCQGTPCFCARQGGVRELCQPYRLQRQPGVPPPPRSATRSPWTWTLCCPWVPASGQWLQGFCPFQEFQQSVWEVVLTCRYEEEILPFIHLLSLV